MSSRKWIKLWCDQWLTGTLRDDEYQDFQLETILKTDARQDVLRVIIRGIWADILALAGDGNYGDIGEIKLSAKIGLTDEQIAKTLCLPLNIWEWAKGIFINGGDEPRIEVSGSNIISIINWPKYQSEYQRQKPYRERKKESNKEKKEIELEDIEVLELEREVEVEVEAKIVTQSDTEKLQSEVTTQETPEWLLILLEIKSFSYSQEWIEDIELRYTDRDLDAVALEFKEHWKGQSGKVNITQMFINSLDYARQKGKFKRRGNGKYDHLIQR